MQKFKPQIHTQTSTPPALCYQHPFEHPGPPEPATTRIGKNNNTANPAPKHFARRKKASFPAGHETMPSRNGNWQSEGHTCVCVRTYEDKTAGRGGESEHCCSRWWNHNQSSEIIRTNNIIEFKQIEQIAEINQLLYGGPASERASAPSHMLANAGWCPAFVP